MTVMVEVIASQTRIKRIKKLANSFDLTEADKCVTDGTFKSLYPGMFRSSAMKITCLRANAFQNRSTYGTRSMEWLITEALFGPNPLMIGYLLSEDELYLNYWEKLQKELNNTYGLYRARFDRAMTALRTLNPTIKQIPSVAYYIFNLTRPNVERYYEKQYKLLYASDDDAELSDDDYDFQKPVPPGKHSSILFIRSPSWITAASDRDIFSDEFFFLCVSRGNSSPLTIIGRSHPSKG